MRRPSWHPDIALADLRIRQGRLAEAEALLLGKDHAMQALLPAARLHLARGDIDLARAAPLAGLRAMATTGCGRPSCWPSWSTPSWRAGDSRRPRPRRRSWPPARHRSTCRPSTPARAAARARVAGRRGRPRPARSPRSRRRSTRSTAGRSRGHGPRSSSTWPACGSGPATAAAAVLDATAAAGILAALDVVLSSADAALLERLVGDGRRGRPARSSWPPCRPDGRWWVVSCDGTTSPPGRTPRACATWPSWSPTPGGAPRPRPGRPGRGRRRPAGRSTGATSGDAGALLDGRAAVRLPPPVEQLRAEIDDAFAAGRLERAEAAQAELDALVASWPRPSASAAGTAGRRRRPSGPASTSPGRCERPSARLDEALPEAGGALDRRLRTGLYCAYEPAATMTPSAGSFSPD